MATPNPMKNYRPDESNLVSKNTFTIAGIATTVYGLDELSASNANVACLWLLHPRLGTKERMESLAHAIVSHWIAQPTPPNTPSTPGLIAVSFDQRNHGSRESSPIRNESWRSGNETHALDLFSIYHGTALDTSQLITYLAAYIFPTSTHTLTDHLVLGVSLGGHAAWHCILHDRRITTAIVIIGCPDYFHLLSDRARLSKLPSWTASTPPGATFIGSQDFPPALVDAVRQYDPAGLFLGPLSARPRSLTSGPAAGEAQAGLRSLLDATLRGKRILCLSGGADKLVPYASSADFLAWLKAAIAPGSWYADGGVVLEDEVFEGVGHELSAGMVAASLRFITQALEERHGSGERIRGAL